MINENRVGIRVCGSCETKCKCVFIQTRDATNAGAWYCVECARRITGGWALAFKQFPAWADSERDNT